MKLQYLGDSKDSYKWDFHDYLVTSLGYELLNIVLMMTPDDGGNHGSSKPSKYPARPQIIDFCNSLRDNRRLSDLHLLPTVCKSGYAVQLHSEDHIESGPRRREYFNGFSRDSDQVVLIDPDNGFEPQKSYSDKHLLFSELDSILSQISERSVVSVFQHFRRKPFAQDFLEISERILIGYATAVYWHSLMFVLVTRSFDVHNQLVSANEDYASGQPVKVITNA